MIGKRKVLFFENFEFDTWPQAIITTMGVIALLVAVTFGTVWLFIHGNDYLYEYEDTVTYCVKQGDTLWTIASRYSSNNHDVRRVIDIIEDINGYTTIIYPGNALEIPVFTCLNS